MEKIMKYAFLNALGTAAYVTAVANFIFFLSRYFPEDGKSFLIPTAMLMLLVLSVAVVGSLLFGRPIMWYADGRKKEAMKLLMHTLGIFLLLTLIVFILVIGILR